MQLNFDGLIISKRIVASVVVWDHTSKIVIACARKYGGGSNNKVKYLVLVWRMRIASARRINRLYIKGYF